MAKGGRNRSRTAAKKGGEKPRTPKRDKGTIHTRLHHARALLGPQDRARLELLVTWSPQKLADAGHLDLGSIKKPRTPEEAVNDEREALFAKAENANGSIERKDPIGRAWYETLLDNHGVDPAVMRDLGREYGWLYWSELQTLDACMSGWNERIGSSGNAKFYMRGNTGTDEVRFNLMEGALAPLGREVRQCLQKLCVDDMWFTEGPAWLDRCINSRRQERRAKGEKCEPPRGMLARAMDDHTLAQAIIGLKALANGVGR